MPVGKRFLAKKRRQIQGSIATRGGRLVGGVYTSRFDQLTTECMRGHLFQLSAKNLLRAWCPACFVIEQSEMKVHLHARCQDLAAQRGGKLLSAEYVSARELLTWECHAGHVWDASADNVRNKESWCPRCAELALKGTPRNQRHKQF